MNEQMLASPVYELIVKRRIGPGALIRRNVREMAISLIIGTYLTVCYYMLADKRKSGCTVLADYLSVYG